jgi:hypothetical protein
VRNATERLKQDVIRRFADELESAVASSSSWPYPGDSLVQGWQPTHARDAPLF